MKATYALSAALLLLALAPAGVRAEDPAAFPVSLGGAVQFLYQDVERDSDAGGAAVERFLTRRVQLALLAKPSAKATIAFTVDFINGDAIDPAAVAGQGLVREAWLGLELYPGIEVQAGSFRPPWTLTMAQPVSGEMFVRYPLIVGNNAFTPWRQTGIMVSGHGGDYLTLALGLFNGLDAANQFQDTNTDKDGMVTVAIEAYPGLRVHLGYWGGRTELPEVTVAPGESATLPFGIVVTNPGTTPIVAGGGSATNTNTWLGVELDRAGFNLGAESLWNRLDTNSATTNLHGYQFELAYSWRRLQPVLRYEFFDPNTANTGAAATDEREWTTIGLNLDLSPQCRLMANYIFKTERQANQLDNDELLVQVSLWY
jgi:hypothetical protein